MSLFYRNLRTIGIGVILASAVNLAYELIIRRVLTEMGSAYIAYIPLLWGIWAKNLLGVTAGAAALVFYRQKKRYSFSETPSGQNSSFGVVHIRKG